MNIKILYGLYATIAFIVLIVIIGISDILMGIKIGIDISAYVVYSGTLIRIATSKVREPKNEKENHENT